MSPVQLVAVFAENKPGQTARLTKILADANINIRWVTVASGPGFGVMKFLVDQCELAHQAFKHQGFVASLVEVLAVEVPDRPGALHAVAECLARRNINLDNTSGFISGGRAILILEVQDLAGARAALQAQGLPLLSQEQMLKL